MTLDGYDGYGGGYPLPVKQLKGTDPVASIDLSNTNLGVVSAIVIAELIKANDSGSLMQVCSVSRIFCHDYISLSCFHLHRST